MSDQSALPDPRIKRLQGANHALLLGQAFGALVRGFEALGEHGVVELIADDHGAIQATLRVTRMSGTYLVTVEPE